MSEFFGRGFYGIVEVCQRKTRSVFREHVFIEMIAEVVIAVQTFNRSVALVLVPFASGWPRS